MFRGSRFLEAPANSGKARLGKLAIAGALLPLEERAIVSLDSTRCFYSLLFRELSPLFVGSADVEVSIVTFNYDRLAELVMASRLAQLENTGWGTARERLLKRVRIVHVYGQLESRIDTTGALAKPVVATDFIRQSADKMRVIPDERAEDDEILAEARQLIWDSDQVAFLGFGFDQTNLSRIGIGAGIQPWTEKDRRILATAIGLAPKLKDRAIAAVGEGLVWSGDNDGAFELVRDHLEFGF